MIFADFVQPARLAIYPAAPPGIQAHRAPVPEEEPLPGEEPGPDQEEPPPHPNPSKPQTTLPAGRALQ